MEVTILINLASGRPAATKRPEEMNFLCCQSTQISILPAVSIDSMMQSKGAINYHCP